MLKSTQEEKDSVIEYYLWQSKDATVTFVQKVYSESVMGHAHDVWDVHASDGRWWIITNPTNLYSQDQFPSMDLAVTFHMGLVLRIPRGERVGFDVAQVRPFTDVFQAISDCDDALAQAGDPGAYRAIGVRCREVLLSFVHAFQDASEDRENMPQRSNFVAWIDLIYDEIQPGPDNKERRKIVKSGFKEAWIYSNWLTHSQSSNWLDAEMGIKAVTHAVEMALSMTIKHLRGVPPECPECQSVNLHPEEGMNTESPDVVFERPICADCGWIGEPVAVGERSHEEAQEFITREGDTGDECGIMVNPLVGLVRPGDDPS